MSDTPGRMLQLLALLQHRTSWSGPELAERLGVTVRTVRRDVDRLRELGYPVEAAPGAHGGYQLGRGGSLPPLLLADDEAVAVAIGLRSAVDGTVSGLEDAAVAVLARLESILPRHLAGRVRAIHVATAGSDDGRPGERIDASLLIGLAHACERSERVRFAYADRAGRASSRLVEPYRLVRVGPRWYLLARDVDRRDWRTFRLDRLRDLDAVGTTFELVDPPDAVAHVRNGLRQRDWPYEARLRIEASADEVARTLPGALGVIHETGQGATVVVVGSVSQDRMVRYLAGLPFACEVLEPPELREALRDRAAALVAANR